MKKNLGLSLLATLILLMAACTRPQPDVNILSLTPDIAAPKQGQTVKVTVKIERVNSYDKPLAVKLDPKPAGVTAPDGVISANGDTTVMDVKFDQSGDFNLNFKVTGDGLTRTIEKVIPIKVTLAEDFTLEVASPLAINPGSNGKALVKVTRNTTMTQAINVTVTNLPAGVTVSPTPLVFAAGSGVQTAELTFTADAAAAAVANKDVTITATGQGGQAVTKTATLKLSVNLLPDFTFDVVPAPASPLVIGQGGTGQIVVKVNRNAAHNSPIEVTLTNLPANNKVTAPATTSISVAQNNTDVPITLTVAPDATVEAGRVITVTATGQGVTKTKTFNLTITSVPPSFTIETVTPDPFVITQSTTGIMKVTVKRNQTLTGTINLTATGMPSGVTVTPITIPAGTPNTSSTADLVFSATPTAAVGSATVTVSATSTGATTQTKAITLTVQAGPAFSFTLSTSAISVRKGDAIPSVTVTLTRDSGFTADVALSMDSLPSGITASFSPATLTGTTLTSTLTLTAAGSVAAGDKGTLVVKGIGGGKTVTQNLTLAITELAITAANLDLVRGIAGALTVNVNRTAFTGPVQVVLSGLPAGVTTSAPSNTITVTGNSGSFTLTPDEGMALGSIGANGEQFSKLLTANLTLTATTTTPAFTRTATPVLKVKPQFELEVYRGVTVGTGTCVETNPINSFALSAGEGIYQTSPVSDWICIKVIRNGGFNKNVYFQYQFESGVLWVGQPGSPPNLGFSGSAAGGEADTVKPRIYFFTEHNQGPATQDYFVRGYEVITPGVGSFKNNVFIDVPLKFVLNP
jgi:hypothetical protein